MNTLNLKPALIHALLGITLILPISVNASETDGKTTSHNVTHSHDESAAEHSHEIDASNGSIYLKTTSHNTGNDDDHAHEVKVDDDSVQLKTTSHNIE